MLHSWNNVFQSGTVLKQSDVIHEKGHIHELLIRLYTKDIVNKCT